MVCVLVRFSHFFSRINAPELLHPLVLKKLIVTIGASFLIAFREERICRGSDSVALLMPSFWLNFYFRIDITASMDTQHLGQPKVAIASMTLEIVT